MKEPKFKIGDKFLHRDDFDGVRVEEIRSILIGEDDVYYTYLAPHAATVNGSDFFFTEKEIEGRRDPRLVKNEIERHDKVNAELKKFYASL